LKLFAQWTASGDGGDDICHKVSGATAISVVRKEFIIEEKPTGRFMIRNRTRVVRRHREGDW